MSRRHCVERQNFRTVTRDRAPWADLTALFDACFRIQREACQAAGRHIPMVVENVRGAQPWVGRARWSFGSFYLWGDVPALMPATVGARKGTKPVPSRGWTQGCAITLGVENYSGAKVPGFRFDGSGRSFQSESVKNTGAHNTTSGKEGAESGRAENTRRDTRGR